MATITSLLQHLLRPEVSEIHLVSARHPAAVVGTDLETIGEGALSSDELLHLLFSAGGSRYAESLGPKASHWRTRVESVGSVSVTAAMHGDVIEARFTLREAQTGPGRDPSMRPPPAPSAAPPAPSPTPSPTPPPPQNNRATRPARPPIHEIEEPAPAAAPKRLSTAPPPPVRASAAPAAKSEPPASTPAVTVAVDDAWDRSAHDRPTPPGGIHATGGPTPPTPEVDLHLPDSFPSAPRTPSAPNARPVPPPTLPNVPAVSAGERPHAALLRGLLRAARDAGASDLHVVAGRPPQLRVAGHLAPRGAAIDAQVVDEMIGACVPRRVKLAFASEEACDFAFEEPELGRFRASVARHRGGLLAAIRPIPLVVPTLASLGLPDALAVAARRAHGLIVVTGPVGHGRSSTIAALVDLLNTETSRHVVTVEDPIEHVHARKRGVVSQREVGTHARERIAALSAAMREDPDALVVGELASASALRVALEACEAGHLVIVSMTAPTAAKAIDRLINLSPPAEQQRTRMTLAGSLRLVAAQRLLPSVDGTTMVVAAEVLPGIPALWHLLRDGRTHQIPSLQLRAKELGIVRLDDALRELLRTGRVSHAVAASVAEAPDELDAAIRKRPATMPPMGSVPPPPLATGTLRPPPGASPRPPPDPGAPKGGIFDRVFKKGG